MLRVEDFPTRTTAGALTFEIPDGRAVGLLGQDDATLLDLAECASGLRAPAAGRILVDNVDVHGPAGVRTAIAVNLSRAAHALTSLGEHASTIASTRRLRMPVTDGIARLGLNARTQLNTPSAKSAAALLAALLPDARLVVLHDPFRGLPSATRDLAVAWIRSLEGSGVALLITGTEERDVRVVCHSVIELGARS